MNNTTISATFMFTDIVGYSTLINKDQDLALELLEKHNQILMPAIENNNGKIIKHTGDGYFAYFLSSNDALTSAIEFQTKIKHHNDISNDKHKFQVRVGIHKGKAINKNNDFFGHAVNVASRIEGLSVFGGIAISDDMYLSLNDDSIYTRKMGYVKMKNIREPILLHNVYLTKSDYKSQTDNELINNQLKRGINIVDIKEYHIKNTFSVGICYFKTADLDKNKRISRNLSEDIMSDFEKINDVRTASKVEVAKYTHSDYSIHDIANKLQVNNILTGEIFFKDNQMKLNIQLFSTFSGDYVFKEEYECGIDNANFLRTKVITRIMKEFDLEIPAHILESLSRKMSENSLAIEKYNKGKYYIERLSSMDDIEKAHQLFKEACKLDSNFIEALTQYGLSFQKLGEFEEAEEYLEKALAQAEEEKYDTGIAFIYNYKGILYKNWGKMKLSLEYFEKAIETQNKLDDNLQEAKILNNVSEHYIRDGNTDKALVCLERARDIMIDLDQTSLLAYIFGQFGNLYNWQENYSKCFENIEKTVTICEEYNMRQFQSQRIVDLADCHANLGLFDSAITYIDSALPMLEEFDNIMAVGRSYLIKGRIMNDMGNVTEAVSYIKDSIEEFQMCDQNWLVLMGNIELAIAYRCDGNHKNTEKALQKVFKIGKRLKGFGGHVLFAKIIQASFNKDKNPDDLYDKLIEYKKNPASYRDWYFLSESYANADTKDKAKECIEISQKLLKERALKNSNKEHQKSMLNNILLHQKILNS